jgi:hypothetical protein
MVMKRVKMGLSSGSSREEDAGCRVEGGKGTEGRAMFA